MKKILLREFSGSVPGYDVVLPFEPGRSNEFLDGLVSWEDYQALFSEVDDRLLEALRVRDKSLHPEYYGVDLLWCFKKELSDFAFYAIQRVEALKKVLAKYPSDTIIVQNRPLDFTKPSLSQILEACQPEFRSRFLIEGDRSEARARNSQKQDWGCFLKERIWPRTVMPAGRADETVLVYSDYAKSKGVLELLPPDRILFYSHVASPMLWWRLFRRGIRYAQGVAPAGTKSTYAQEATRLSEAASESSLFANIRWDGLSAEKLLKPKVHDIFHHAVPGLLHHIRTAHDLLARRKNLKAALLDEDISPYQNAFCQVARQYGVTTYVECHGALGIRNGFLPLTADYLCAWGEKSKSKLMSWGGPADRILITGCSRYEPYGKIDALTARKSVAKRLGLDPARPIILIACHPTDDSGYYLEDTIREAVKSILKAVEGFSQAQFIIKLHPGERSDFIYREWVSKNNLKGRAVILKRYDPLLLAKVADFLVVYMSTYAIDGLALGRNVVLYRDRLLSTCEEYLDFNVMYEAHDPDGIREAARNLLKDPDARKGDWDGMRRQCLNGKSSHPAMKTMAELLAGKLAPAELL